MKMLIVSIGCALLLASGYSCSGAESNSSKKTKKMERVNYSEEEMELLSRLNYWVQNGGDAEHPVDSIKVQGEASSMVDNLKKKIADAGLMIKWDGTKYIFID